MTVTTSAVFNDPSGTTADQNRIRDYIVSLIDATPAGESITASVYTFTDGTASQALVNAKQRGVNVRLIVDHTTVTMTGGEYTTLANGLGTDRTQPSWVMACPSGRGCIGNRELTAGDPAINHNKFWLFSNVGGASNVVVQTSSNMTGSQRTDYFNNAATIVDSGLYGIYQSYFSDLLSYGSSSSGSDNYYTTPTSSTGPYKAYFFPRHEASGTSWDNDASTDTVKLILDNVSCSGGTQIRVAMNLFSRDEVAKKLVSLVNSGCSVYLAADGAPGSMSTAVTNTVYGKLTKRVECYENSPDGTYKIGLHSKYLLIQGTYDGVANRKLVWTGSHNYTYSALRANDEALLKIDNSAIYDQYKVNHDTLMAYCAGS
ncbi:phospholipase D-like domain-containing protein [Streptomyces sp. NK08204]|uniref:phospholipase D-like domain-containing protein n=1 Tax=Streptomyces sp. NK08204 TaxID=2873260 RepID=UPI001CECA728|nr:phospholipase D-like domain-containing protein [Streptomyces sp. NK08204]